jgi:hypothetical protein
MNRLQQQQQSMFTGCRHCKCRQLKVEHEHSGSDCSSIMASSSTYDMRKCGVVQWDTEHGTATACMLLLLLCTCIGSGWLLCMP